LNLTLRTGWSTAAPPDSTRHIGAIRPQLGNADDLLALRLVWR
jgi:hypothetical protein